ncbi:MAG: hypothetical protein ACRC8W_03280 [Plesiomonas shigelloides]
MNAYTNELGVTYVAIDAVNNCEGCDLRIPEQHYGCTRLEVSCAPEDRPDGRNVIWKSVGECVDPVSIELTFAATDRIDAVRNTVARLRAVYEPHFTVGKTEITRRGDHIIVSIPLGAKLDR